MTDAFVVEYDRSQSTATVRLIRSDQGNRLTPPDMTALGNAIREAGESTTVKLVILRGEGPDFCLGRMPPAAPPTSPPSALDVRERVTKPILSVYENIRQTPVPVMALVHGNAEGFGCAMTGGCDLAIAAEEAMFSLPEMDNNLPPTLAMSALLHKVPHKQLMHLVYTRDTFTAKQALAWDVVTQVTMAAQFESTVQETVSKLVDRNRRALCAVKEYMLSAPFVDTHSAARLAANTLATVFSSPNEVA